MKYFILTFVCVIALLTSKADAHIIRGRCLCDAEKHHAVVVKEKVVIRFVPFKKFCRRGLFPLTRCGNCN